MRKRDIYPQDYPRTVRSRRNRFGNTELACSPKYHGAKTAYWAVGRQTGNYAVVVAKSASRYAPVAWVYECRAKIRMYLDPAPARQHHSQPTTRFVLRRRLPGGQLHRHQPAGRRSCSTLSFPASLLQMTIQRAETQTSTPAKLAASHAATHKLRH